MNSSVWILRYVCSTGSRSRFTFLDLRPVWVAWILIPFLTSCGFKVNNQTNLASLVTQSKTAGVTLNTPGPKLSFVNVPAAGASLKGGASYTLSWTASENDSAVKTLSVQYSGNGTDFSDLSTSLKKTDTSYDWTVPTVNVSAAVFKISASDANGNVSELVSPTFSIDSSAPLLGWNPPVASGSYSGGSTFSLSYSTSDTGNGDQTVKLQYASDGSTFADVATLTTAPYSWTLPSSNTTTAKLRLISTDAAGNSTTLTSSAFTIDSILPNTPSVTLVSATPTNNTAASFTLSSCTDFAGIYISESSTTPSPTASGWTSCTTTAGATTTTLSSGNGIKTVYFWSKDSAGNISSSSASVSINLLQTPPGAPSITLTSGTPTSSTATTYTVTSCAGISDIFISESNIPPTAGAAGWSVCSTTASATAHTLSAGEGIKNVYFYAKDALGNISPASVVTVTLDQTAPGAPSISLASVNPTNSTAATYTVASCTDRAAVYASVSTTTPTAGAAGWQTCSQSPAAITFTLPSGDGAKAVNFWAKDSASNVSATYSTVNVTVDATGPTLAITTPAAGAYTNNSNKAAFTVSGSCSENGRTVSVRATDTTTAFVSDTPTCNTGASPNWSTSLDLRSLTDGAITLSATQTDSAGNSTNASTVAITKDTGNPTVAVTAPAASNYVNNSGKTAVVISGSCSENGRNVAITATDTGATSVNSTVTCNTSSAPNWTASLNFSTLTDGVITIATTHTDVSGNSGSNNLNVTLDTATPANATTLGWAQTSPSTSNTVNASWTLSAATDLASQSVQYYSDGTCTASSGSAVSAGVLNTQSFSGTSGSWSYKVTSVDAAGNSDTSGCSSAMVLREASLANSALSVSSSSIQKGQTSTITLTVKDSSAVQNTVGGYTVSFSASSGVGVSTGTISAVTDHNNGTYTATFTATAKGIATTITASINGVGTVTSTPPTITVTNTAPTLTALTNQVLPIDTGNAWLQGNTNTITLSGSDADGDSLSYSCTYQSLGLGVGDPNYAASGTNCTSLASLVTTNSTLVKSVASISGEVFTWTPTSTQRGTFLLSFTANDGTTTSSAQTVIVTVKGNDTTSKLLSALDAQFSTNASGLAGTIPSAPLPTSSSPGSWINLISTAANVSLASFSSANPWIGGGTDSNPYALNFDSTYLDSMSLSTVLNTSTQFALETWVKPSSLSTAGSVIASNGGETGDGFVLKQTSSPTNRIAFVVGKKYYSYKDLILSHKPIAYWRLDELAGTTANDLSAYSINGTYSNVTLNNTGAIAGDSNSSASFNGTTSSVNMAALSNYSTTSISYEAWVKPASNVSTGVPRVVSNYNTTTYSFIMAYTNNQTTMRCLITTSGGSVTATSTTQINQTNQWYHLTCTWDGANLRIYVNGVNEATTAIAGTLSNTSNSVYVGNDAGGSPWNGLIDDVSIYNVALSATQVTEHYQTGKNGNYKSYPGNAILADNPAGYWRLNEKAGISSEDLSGSNGTGTYTGGYTLGAPGIASSASSVELNGTSGYVNTGFTQTSVTAYSAEAWVKTTSTASQKAIVQNRGSGNGYSLTLALETGLPEFSVDRASIRCGIRGTTSVADGNWHYIVGTWSAPSGTTATNSQFQLYVDGVKVSTTNVTTACASATSPFTGLGTMQIGRHQVWNTYFSGNISEVAVYNYALSATQVASHYNSGNGPSWWFCQSVIPRSVSTWTLISALYDGTNARLFTNGQEVCSVTPGTTYSGAVANTRIGADTTLANYWNGALAWLRVFGTSDGSAPASATTIANDFNSTANRFRAIPLENIVTNGLAFNFDAANARQGIAPYTNGCASTDLIAWDLSPNNLDGTLFNFSGCGATTGWVGAGTPGNPYAIAFDGTNDSINLGTASALNFGTGDFTVSTWYKTTTSSTSVIFGKGGWSYQNGYNIYASNTGGAAFGFQVGGVGSDSVAIRTTSAYNNGNWHLATAVVDRTAQTVKVYVDGILRTIQLAVAGTCGTISGGTQLNISGCPLLTGTSSYTAAIGNQTVTNSSYFNGSVASVQAYNRALTPQEIKQNCLAQEGRFTSTAQSICGAP